MGTYVVKGRAKEIFSDNIEATIFELARDYYGYSGTETDAELKSLITSKYGCDLIDWFDIIKGSSIKRDSHVILKTSDDTYRVFELVEKDISRVGRDDPKCTVKKLKTVKDTYSFNLEYNSSMYTTGTAFLRQLSKLEAKG